MTVTERQLTIAGVLDQVQAACDFVVEQARAAGLDERSIHHCYLAVDEACTNIVEHGYGGGCPTCTINVICQQEGDTLTITIIDTSPAFDPLLRPDPDPTAPMSQREPGGWGIFFIKKLMDHVNYFYDGKRNRLVMSKRIRANGQGFKPDGALELRPVEITEVSRTACLIMITGRLDATQTKALETVFERLLASGFRWMIVDMSTVEYIGSTGLKILVSSWQRLRDLKGDLVLVSLNQRAREVLEITGLNLVFTIMENEDQARAYFASKTK